MKRVLLADDSVAARKSIQTVLEMAGIDVVAVGNGDLALARLDEVAPRMVLLDAIMPGRSGYEVCAEIKRDARFSGIPVLLVTTEFEPYDEQLARASGADGHLIKPLEAKAIAVMRQVWDRYALDASGPLADVGAPRPAASDPEPEPEAWAEPAVAPPPKKPAIPGPESFITATMRAVDVEEQMAARDAAVAKDARDAAAAKAAERAAPKADDPLDTEPRISPLPDRVIEPLAAVLPAESRVNRAPTTETLSHEIADEANVTMGDVAKFGVQLVPLGDRPAAEARCRSCGVHLNHGDVFCITCGALALVTTAEAEEIADDAPTILLCPECHQELIVGEIFCVTCGAVV